MESIHTLWSNEDLKIGDWEESFWEEHPEANDDSKKYQLICEENDSYLNDERENLNIELGRDIILIADLGLWYGRRTGYKIVGRNIRNCLSGTCGDYITWYVDEHGDLRCSDTHHDRTNYYLYRVFRANVSEAKKERFKNKILNDELTEDDISRYTARLGNKIAKVYGFTIKRKKSA